MALSCCRASRRARRRRPLPRASPARSMASGPSRTKSPSVRPPEARARDGPSHQRKEIPMNWDRIEGNWKQVTGRAKVQWGKLTDDDLDVVAGRRDQLAGKIQERYGIAKDEAEKQLSAWESKADDTWFS